MYKPPLPQPQLDRTPITCDRTVLSKTYAISKKAERHNLAKLITCAIILLPANLAFSVRPIATRLIWPNVSRPSPGLFATIAKLMAHSQKTQAKI